MKYPKEIGPRCVTAHFSQVLQKDDAETEGYTQSEPIENQDMI